MKRSELLAIGEELKSLRSLNIELRGTGKSTFIYMRSAVRAAEISLDGDEFFVEYWDEASEQSDRASVKSETLPSRSDAVKKLSEWFHRCEQ